MAMTAQPHVVVIDNRDSFIYNLVDALAGHHCTVFRNTVSVETVLAAKPDLLLFSPGPGHPRETGSFSTPSMAKFRYWVFAWDSKPYWNTTVAAWNPAGRCMAARCR